MARIRMVVFMYLKIIKLRTKKTINSTPINDTQCLNSMVSTEKKRFLELDALRGIAALVVVLFHYTRGKVSSDSLFNLGTTGVDLFFIISGFVIFMSLTRVKTSLEFAINRASRLYPTYWTVVTFTFLLILVKTIFNYGAVDLTIVGQYLANMTMFQFYMRVPNLDGPYWTMIIEMIFYIAMAALFHVKLLKRLNLASVIIISATLAGMLFFSENVIVRAVYYGIPLLQFLPLFLAGTVFYKMHQNDDRPISNYLMLIFCFGSQVLMYDTAGSSMNYISQERYALMLGLYFGLFVLFVDNKLSKIISKPSLFLGKISYGLYLIHQYVGTKMLIPFLTENVGLNFWISELLITLPIVVALATSITYLVEEPMNKLMRTKLRKLMLGK
jgi:peptidoglycan/LPS O-acetylase OafA/YrhL